MPSLGEIAVNLTLNSAQFLSAFSAVGAASKKFRSELSDSISGIGSTLEGVAGKFGEFGSIIGQTLGQATSAASSALLTFGKFGGSIGTIAGLGAGAAAGLLAVEGAAIGLAIHTAEGAAQLGELSARTGVSTRTLAGLSIVGKAVGVDVETMGKGLGLMNANMVKAAIAPEGTKTAFSRLGIEIKDTSGKMRDTQSVFLDVVSKLSNLPQPQEGFFARQIFGKGGIAMIPIIEQGADRLREVTEAASSAGLGDPATVAASQKFKETLADFDVVTQGAALRLTRDLLPALQFVADWVLQAFKTGSAQAFIDKIAEVTRYAIAMGGTFVAAFREWIAGGELIQTVSTTIIEAIMLIGEASAKPWRIFESDFKSRVANLNFGGVIKNAFSSFSTESRQIKKDMDAFIDGVMFSTLKTPTAKAKTASADLTPAKEDTTLARIQERIAALVREAAEWAKVASAGTQAEALIAEATKKGTEEFGKLKAEAAKDKTGKAQALVIKDEDIIKSAAAESVFGGAIKTLLSELDKQKEKLGEQASAAISLGDAYKKGGAAIANAALAKQFAEQAAKINVLEQVHDRLAVSQGENATVVLQFAAAIAQANKTLAESKEEERIKLSAELTDSLNQQSGAYVALKPYVTGVSDAYLQGERALRAARIELELQKFAYDELNKGLVVTQAQIQQKRKILEDADRQAHTDAIQQQAAQYDLNLQYNEEILKLEQIKEALQAVGASTLLVEAAEFDAQNKMLHQWDEAVFKVGTFGQKVQGVFNELIIQGREAGSHIAGAFLTAIDGAETQLAKFLTGQKVNFKQVFDNLAESLVKIQIQKAVGAIAGGLGINLGKLGLGGKPDGSSSSTALWVRLAGGGLGAGAGEVAGIPTGGGGIFGKFAKAIGLSGIIGGGHGAAAPDGTQANPFYVMDASGAEAGLFGGGGAGGGGFFSTLLNSVGGLFGGGGSLPFSAGELGAPSALPGVTGATGSSFSFGDGGLAGLFPGLAEGGDVQPGKAYIVGEKRPEFFVPDRAGRITPEIKAGGDTRNITIKNDFHGFKDTDMFRRSATQLSQMLHRQVAIANRRG